MKLFTKATITAALAAITLAPVLSLAPASAAEPVAPAPASVSQQVSVEQAPTAEQRNHTGGVRITIENHTDKGMQVASKSQCDYIRPGERVTVFSKYQEFVDDLELAVTVGKREYDPDAKRILEIDASNPRIGYPNINLTHLPTGTSDMEYFSTHESQTMLDGRAWVKRHSDDDHNNKQFDIHIKNAS